MAEAAGYTPDGQGALYMLLTLPDEELLRTPGTGVLFATTDLGDADKMVGNMLRNHGVICKVIGFWVRDAFEPG